MTKSITPMTPHKWATVNQVAQILDVHPSTVRRWISAGVIGAVRIGKTTLRVDLDSLQTERVGIAA